jgi:hypothetical protein
MGGLLVSDQISREFGLFQQDCRDLSVSQLKKLQSISWLICQLRRFTREELKILYTYCDELIQDKTATVEDPEIDYRNIVIDQDTIELSNKLHDNFEAE